MVCYVWLFAFDLGYGCACFNECGGWVCYLDVLIVVNNCLLVGCFDSCGFGFAYVGAFDLLVGMNSCLCLLVGWLVGVWLGLCCCLGVIFALCLFDYECSELFSYFGVFVRLVVLMLVLLFD